MKRFWTKAIIKGLVSAVMLVVATGLLFIGWNSFIGPTSGIQPLSFETLFWIVFTLDMVIGTIGFKNDMLDELDKVL